MAAIGTIIVDFPTLLAYVWGCYFPLIVPPSLSVML